MISFLRKMVRRTRNFFYWLPIILRDEHWDHRYFWEIMRHKISAMLDHTENCPMGRQDEVLDHYRQAIGLLDDLIDGRYEDRAYESHTEIFGPSKWEIREPTEDEMADGVTGRPKHRRLEITYPAAEDQDLAERALLAFGRMAELNNRIALNALGELIKLSDRWWD